MREFCLGEKRRKETRMALLSIGNRLEKHKAIFARTCSGRLDSNFKPIEFYWAVLGNKILSKNSQSSICMEREKSWLSVSDKINIVVYNCVCVNIKIQEMLPYTFYVSFFDQILVRSCKSLSFYVSYTVKRNR